MAFSDYKTLDQVQKEFNILYQEEAYLGTQPVDLSLNFLAEMEFNRENIDVFASEGARAEAIIRCCYLSPTTSPCKVTALIEPWRSTCRLSA